MRSLAVGSLVAGASVSLWGVAVVEGVRQRPELRTPAPYLANTAQNVWGNHFTAFATFDVPRIMLDYDEDSVIKTFNDVCFSHGPDTPTGLKIYKGTGPIQGFFEALFTQLNNNLANVPFIGPNNGPVVKNVEGGIYDANVFLTWKTQNLDNPIDKATDSFSFKQVGDKFKIDLQTIVTTEPRSPCSNPVRTQAATTEDTPLHQGWNNHLSAFGGKNLTKIMEDYDEHSIVQVFDFNGDTYEEHKGLAAIQNMFSDLFAAIQGGATTPGDASTEGIQVGLLEVDPDSNSVFLAWQSNSHPRATDTFIFNGATIARQNIVVTTAPVQNVWDNHFSAFATFDVPRIMLDYDEDSVITTFNDFCFSDGPNTPTGLKTYKGTGPIQGFFEALFTQLNNNLANVPFVGPNKGPVVKESEGNDYAGNVFLTWKTQNLDNPIDKATDSFSFRKVGATYKIHLQTIVTTEPRSPCSNPIRTQAATTEDTPLHQGWNNHLSAFGGKNLTKIMEDYDENSIVQVFDFNGDTYEEHKGLAAIQNMFSNLFEAIQGGATTPGDAATEGIQVGLLEVDPDFNSVFLAWQSNSHPKATDTFIFNGATIARQNIVVTTN